MPIYIYMVGDVLSWVMFSQVAARQQRIGLCRSLQAACRTSCLPCSPLELVPLQLEVLSPGQTVRYLEIELLNI